MGNVRASVDKANQLGVEAESGNIVPANRYLPTLSFMMRPRTENQKFTAQGSRVPTTAPQHKRWGSGSYDGVVDYNSLMYILSGLFPHPAEGQIGAIQAFKRLYRPGVRTSDNARKTYTIQPGDAVAVDDYPYCQLTGMQMELGQDDTKISGNIVSQYPTFNGAKTTAGVVSIPERPVLRNEINIYMDALYANIGTTQVTEARRETLSIGEKFKEAWFHNRSKPSWSGTVELPYEGLFSFVTAHNAQSRGYLDALATQEWCFLRMESVGQLLGTIALVDYYETMIWDIAGKMMEPQEIGNDDGIQGYQYNLLAIDNPDLGRAYQCDLTNSLATL